jgi:hypothetical protein
MSHWKSFAAGLLVLSSFPLITYARSGAAKPPDTTNKNASAQQSNVKQSAGEQQFAQNCGRCHTPPEGFSPRISGTIIRHMRVRASLREQDEADILHFLNP